MIRSVIVVVMILVGALSCAAQDFRKVVEIVDEMETSLRKSISQEQEQRKSEIAVLRRDVDALRQGQRVPVSADTAGSTAALQQQWREIDRRLTLLEKRADKAGKDVADLTQAVALLVQELKKSVK